LFGDRVVAEDGGQGKVISLRAPTRAQDSSTVPIAISTRIDQTPERYVRKVYLLIDKNPSPIAAIFTFTPESGRADIETRVRIEDYNLRTRHRGTERRAAVCPGTTDALITPRKGPGYPALYPGILRSYS
jgi:predicted secreted protein